MRAQGDNHTLGHRFDREDVDDVLTEEEFEVEATADLDAVATVESREAVDSVASAAARSAIAVGAAGLSGDARRVYIVARKVMVRNTRIFKQARSLVDAGYSVTVIGILPRGGLPREERDGYSILRLPLAPIYITWPRRLRAGRRRVERVLLRLPVMYLRTAARVRRVRRAVLRRTIGPLAGPASRTRLGTAQAWRFLTGPVRTGWAKLRRLVDGSEAPRKVDDEMKLLALPVALLALILRALFAAGDPIAAQAARVIVWARSGSILGRLLRAGMRHTVRLLRHSSEFVVVRLTKLLRRFKWPLASVNFYRSVYRLVTSELPAPEIIHVNDLDALLIGALLARRYKAPLLYDAQELYTGVHTLPRWYTRTLALQERLLIRRADRITVVNDEIAAVMASRYHVRIDSVVLNCPPLTYPVEDSDEARTLRDVFGLAEDEIVLLYSGGLGPQRGIENCVLALTELEHAVLVLLGEGNLRPVLDAMIEHHGLEGRVFFSDFVAHHEVPNLISSADVGLIPYENVGINHYLCSPSKLFHYIMAEVPVACSDFPFLRSVVVDNGVGAVFDPSDPRSIARAVRSIVEVPGARAACRERLRVIRQRYCWEEEEKRMMSVYASLPVASRELTGSRG